MSELEEILVGAGAAAAPAHIIEGLGDDLVHRMFPGAPRSIYQELWHIAFWQQVSLDWARGLETPYPATPSGGFPSEEDTAQESWQQLCRRFLGSSEQVAAVARDTARLDAPIRCPSRPGEAVRVMTVREQLENLAAHNAYHFGRIVLLRQLSQAWPPASGGFSW